MPAYFRSADEDLIGRVQAHYEAYRHYHLQVAVLVTGILTADFGKKIRAAPAQEGRKG